MLAQLIVFAVCLLNMNLTFKLGKFILASEYDTTLSEKDLFCWPLFELMRLQLCLDNIIIYMYAITLGEMWYLYHIRLNKNIYCHNLWIDYYKDIYSETYYFVNVSVLLSPFQCPLFIRTLCESISLFSDEIKTDEK
jgi:hypothetical protein